VNTIATSADLDPVLHQPVRTRLVAYLAGRGEATFSELKKALEITDGNLEAHMKKLTAAEYVETEKETGEGRPQTVYRLTAMGRDRLERYVATLQSLFTAP
jgi:predicted ArsR family transcriptional regulator